MNGIEVIVLNFITSSIRLVDCFPEIITISACESLEFK